MSLKSSNLSGVKLFGFKTTTLIWFSKPTLTHTFTTIYAASQDNSVCLLGGQFWAPHLSLVKLHSSSDDGAWVRSFSHLFWSRGRQQDGFFMTPQNKKKPKQHHIWLSFFSHLNSKEGVNHASLISSIFWEDCRWLLSEQLHFRGGQKFDTRNLF